MSINKPEPKDYFETPPEEFVKLDQEFNFEWDACATASNAKVPGCFFDESQDALTQRWSASAKVIWCNPPWSKSGMKDAFIEKAAEAQADGATVVMCLPAKVNTKAFHKYIWDKERHSPRPGVQIRYPEGRWAFYKDGKPTGGGRNEVMVVVFYARIN